MTGWKLTGLAPREVVQSALLLHEDRTDLGDWDDDIVIAGSEVAENRPLDWQIEAWLPRRPTKADRTAIAALFATGAPELIAEKLPDTDWLVMSQQAVQPIRAGAFHVRTPEFPAPDEAGIRDLVIPASQAFGTGQHATTAGCLAMLTAMRRSGMVARNIADIGTGTGLLAFAALDLWPRAHGLASDIDAVCVPVVEENAARNGFALGGGAGELLMTVAPGCASPLISARAPYDLVIANILAGPLIDLAPDFARITAPRGSLLLAGLLETQEAAVRRACFRNGFRLARRAVHGDWSILWLRRRGSGRCSWR